MENWKFYAWVVGVMGAIGAFAYKVLTAKADAKSLDKLEAKVEEVRKDVVDVKTKVAEHGVVLVNVKEILEKQDKKLDAILMNGNGHKNGKLRTRRGDKQSVTK